MSKPEKSNSEAPHTAVLVIKGEVHQRLQTGELAGDPVHRVNTNVAIDGATLEDCLQKLKEFLKP